MTREEFEAGILKITSAFMQEAPEAQAISAWFQIIGNIPLAHFNAVVSAYIGTTKRLTRGTNLGCELSEKYAVLKQARQAEKFSQQAAKPVDGCPHCTPGFPGFVRIMVKDGNNTYMQMYRCACNHDSRFSCVPLYSQQQEAI